jgi:hypothetical protein
MPPERVTPGNKANEDIFEAYRKIFKWEILQS